jgi:hypothetical protein
VPIEYPDPVLVLTVSLVGAVVYRTAMYVQRRRNKMVFAVGQARLRREFREREHERARLKAAVPTLFADLSSAFFEVDPGLVNYETNDDEYEAEVAAVLPRLSEARSADDVVGILQDEFDRWFHRNYDIHRLDRLAERTWAIWESAENVDHVTLRDGADAEAMPEYPRALDSAERAMLDFMLAVDDSRFEPLRVQARTATVASKCDCGCATINLAVDRLSSPIAPGLSSAVIDARRRPPYPPDDFYEMIVFCDSGWLSSLEVVWYREPIPVMPDPATLTAPEAMDRRASK